MQEITAYKLSNGIIVEDEEAAIKMQREINIKKRLEDWCNKHLVDFDYGEIADIIYENRDSLLFALNDL